MAAWPRPRACIADGAIAVLDHGFVRLDDAMASDLSVVNSARVGRRRKKEMDESDEGLIRFLRAAGGTPFEHNAFRFHIRAPIFVQGMDATPHWLVQRVP